MDARGIAARDTLVVEHQYLVDVAVASFLPTLPACVPEDELRSAGTLGLLKAAGRYDPTKGVRFSTYALTRIRGEILDYLREQDWASRCTRRDLKRVESAKEALIWRLGRAGTEEELMVELGVSELQLRQLLSLPQYVVSLDAEGNEKGGSLLKTLQAGPEYNPEACVLDKEARDIINKKARDVVKKLSKRLQHIMTRIYFDGKSQAEVAREMGIGFCRVSQLHAQALEQLRVLTA